MGKAYHLGLIGYPIAHSLSPLLHHAALKACGIEGRYRLFPTLGLPDGEKSLRSIIEKIKLGELDGVNITIPHKQNVITLVDRVSPTAAAVGAVNTIHKKDGILYGENTDVAGFTNDLKRIGVAYGDNQFALVLGAGGAARAVIWGLLSVGWRVCVLARRYDQAQQTAIWISENLPDQNASTEKRISAIKLEASVIQHLTSSQDIKLIVNATPLGMALHPQGVVWPFGIPIPNKATVYDLVYTPPVTELIRLAQQAGLPAFNGLGMLVEQAALAFELWSGLQAPRDAMWQAVSYIQETI